MDSHFLVCLSFWVPTSLKGPDQIIYSPSYCSNFCQTQKKMLSRMSAVDRDQTAVVLRTMTEFSFWSKLFHGLEASFFLSFSLSCVLSLSRIHTSHVAYSPALCSQLYWVCLTVLVKRVWSLQRSSSEVGPSGHRRQALEVLWEKPLRSAMATEGLQHSTSSPRSDLRKGNLGWRIRGVVPELFPERSASSEPPTRIHMTAHMCVCVHVIKTL